MGGKIPAGVPEEDAVPLVLKGRKERQTYRERKGAEREIWKIRNSC